jgi:xenotropic and polytropic retrovirus receptor 1
MTFAQLYYVSMVLDAAARFSWVIYLAPQPSVALRGFILGCVEVFRRWLWNFVRVESEHVGSA